MTNPIDKSILRQVIIDFPEQLEKALEFSKDVKADSDFNRLVVCGMGGSALPADVVDSFLKSKGINIPIAVCRDYRLPEIADEKSLILASSYSGNTEETISCYLEAREKDFLIIGLSRGGKIQELCQRDGIPHIKYPEDGPTFQPRYAIGYAFTAMISILMNCGKLDDVSSEVRELAKYLRSINFENEGKNLAKKLIEKIPIIYSTAPFEKSIARIVKIKINENAKTQAFYNVFPELNHNEMVGFTNLQGNYHFIIFKDLDEHERNLKRIEITSQVLRGKGIPVTVVNMAGATMMQKIFSSIIYGDWISYYLALEYGQDPTPVEMVEEFKKKMEE